MTKFFIAAAALLAPQLTLAAEPAPVRATLATPLAAPQRVAAGAASWTCTGAACVGPASNARLGDARACRELAHAVGALSAFTGTRGDLSADDLTKCNKAARPAG